MSETRTCDQCGFTAWADSARVRQFTIESDDASTVIDAMLCADCIDEVRA